VAVALLVVVGSVLKELVTMAVPVVALVEWVLREVEVRQLPTKAIQGVARLQASRIQVLAVVVLVRLGRIIPRIRRLGPVVLEVVQVSPTQP
jgi:hypothetical protein